MKKAVVFGIGKNFERRKDVIEREFDIVGVVDNFKSNGETPEKLKDYDFDTVIITPNDYLPIKQQLLQMGIPEGKIKIDVFDYWKDKYCKTIFNLNFYSAEAEDLIVAAVFHQIGIEKPSYMDLGAYHPFAGSNTALLYENGCRGINIDASPGRIDAFQHFRPEDINLNIGVAEKSGTLTFYMNELYPARNTFHKPVVQAVVCEADIKTQRIPVVTLDYIVRTYCKDGRFPDYLDCDIEGFDFQVLNSYPLQENGPKVILVERDSDEKFNEMLDEKGYFKYCGISWNNLYVKKEYSKTLRAIEL